MSEESLAVWFEGLRSAGLRREERGSPGSGEVLVEAEYSAISAGTEMLVYRGEVSPGLGLDLPTFSGGFGFPVKYGYALTGKVTEVGDGVDRSEGGLEVGDSVFALHPHQSECVVPSGLVVKLPEGVSMLEGVFFANLETATNIVLDTPTKLGETVVVAGQGVVGLLVCALLARSGVKVVAVDPVEKRRELAQEFGAACVVSPGGMEAAVREVTRGRGADVFVEVSGSAAALDAALGCVAMEGTVVVASWYGTKKVSLDLGGDFHRRRVGIKSSQVGGISPEISPRWNRERRTEQVLELMPNLGLTRLVSHRFPLADAPEVYRRLDTDEEFGEEVVQVVFDYRGLMRQD